MTNAKIAPVLEVVYMPDSQHYIVMPSLGFFRYRYLSREVAERVRAKLELDLQQATWSDLMAGLGANYVQESRQCTTSHLTSETYAEIDKKGSNE